MGSKRYIPQKLDKKKDMNLLNMKTTTLVWTLSLAGYIPFALLAIALYKIGQSNELFISFFDVFKVWSALILSFLGGIRWGFAIANEPFENKNLLISVVPTILAWFVLLLPDAYTILALLVLFCLHGVWDSFYINQGKIAPWFGKVRITLTFLVVVAHVVVLFAIS